MPITDNDLAARAEKFIRQIEDIDTDLASEKGEYMARCRPLRDARKDVFGAAKDAGIQVKPLKAVIKRRKHEREIEALPSEFDIDESAQYQALAEAFAGTPFGSFAAERAQETADNGDGRREDEQHLARIGRGGDPIDQLGR